MAVVHGYEVSFIPTECFIRKKADISTAILQSSSEHTQHAQNTAVYALHDEDCRISSRNVSFFPIKHLVGIKDTL